MSAKRGFGGMTAEKRTEIARLGGRAAHEKGTAHEFNSEEARRAGQKGGTATSRDRAHMVEIGQRGGAITSRDREHMAEIGRRGGLAVSAGKSAHMAEIGRKGGLKRARMASGTAGETQPTVDEERDEAMEAWLSRREDET